MGLTQRRVAERPAMSDTAQIETEGPPPSPPVVTASEDRLTPAVVYALYLIGLVNGVTILIGLIVAYVVRDKAGPRMASHYEFLIRTFWIGLAVAVIAGAVFAVGLPLSLILVGIPLLLLSGAIISVLGIWFAVRAIVGAVYLARDEAYPRPKAYLI
jgi:uncharacterized membrane protein